MVGLDQPLGQVEHLLGHERETHEQLLLEELVGLDLDELELVILLAHALDLLAEVGELLEREWRRVVARVRVDQTGELVQRYSSQPHFV